MTQRSKTIQVNCACCGDEFTARIADRKRGWAKFCSKSCKAKKQEQRTGQYHRHLNRTPNPGRAGEFTDAHLFSNEEHDCNKDFSG